MKQDLICILGPTASGKTRYAVELALKYDGEIISADSRQVYRGMDIGTGKDLSEYIVAGANGSVRQIPYHLIDIVAAGEKYNVFQYQKDFWKAYKSILARGRVPILCGGTGLYIDSVTRGYSLPEVPENKELRAVLEQQSMEELANKLSALKPLHNKTDFDSKKRLIRALEIEYYRVENPVLLTHNPALNTKFIGIDVDRSERNAKIDKRLHQRLQNGLIDEVNHLLSSGISPEDLIYYGLEYKYVTMYILGQLTMSEMEQKLATAIHQFAKRQMTWFRGMERRGVVIDWIKV